MSEKEPQIRGDEESAAGIDTSAAQIPTSESNPEIERLRTENETLKSSLKMLDARGEIMQLLTAAGANSPELLFAAAKENLQFSDEGKLINASAITAQLRRSFPEQFGFERPPETIDGGAGSSRAAQYLTADALSKMTSAQIKELDWQTVKQVLGTRE